ncbi:MAG: hypothetical protein HLX48_04435 [Halomonas sp.]|uniref:hypothetical protein n=1 Tax=Halomonas TaxID=2745 RepID=UPI000489344F|nr:MULTISPECIES: hypothetical protein [Halomonas]NWN82235.1 hypothetical protein [Halomonas sp.]
MNLHRAYRLLALFYTLLLLIGAIALLAGGGTALSLVQLALGAVAVVGLWGYILRRGFMNPRLWRPLAAVLAVAALAQLWAVFSMSLPGELLTWMLVSTIFSLLLVVILYRYGDRDQALWATPEELEAARQLEKLLDEREGPLQARIHDEERESRVTVIRADDGYHASVTRRRRAEREAFEEHFRHPATLVFFLEKFAGVSVGDFKHGDAA